MNLASERLRLSEAQKRVDKTVQHRARLTRGLAHAAALGLDVAIFQQSLQSIEATLGALTAHRDMLRAVEETPAAGEP